MNNIFENTGELSFYLGIAFILLALAGVIVAFIVMLRNSLSDGNLDKLISLFKWLIVTVALVVGATIITDGFKERDQDVQELAVFEKYVDTITAANGIEKRWLLAEYFSKVAPPGELRKSWEAYRLEIKPSLDEYKANKAKLSTLESIEKPTTSEKQKIAELQDKTEVLEQSLIEKDEPQEWLIIAGGDSTIREAKFEVAKAKKLNFDAVIYKKGNMFRMVIPGFTTKTDAVTRLPEIKTSIDSGSYIVKLNTWCREPKAEKEYLVCK